MASKKPGVRWVRVLALLLVLGAVGFGALTAVRGLRTAASLVHPSRSPVVRPSGPEALTGLEDVSFQSAGQVLRGWYRPSRDGTAVVLVHGFAANRTQLLFEAGVLAASGHGVLLFDLHGQGESDGDAIGWGDSEREDVRAALSFVRARPEVTPGRVGLFGFSMGGTTALLVAQEDPRVKAVAAVGAFPDLAGDMGSHYGASTWAVLWGLRRAGIDVGAVRPLDGMCRLEGRGLLLINGGSDPDGPQKLGASLYRAACEPRQLWEVPDAAHGEYARKDPEGYARHLREFFDRAL
ncbi:alpha/beta hydrolase [Corallococcus terminator]|uniref:Alpha/beta fold hydrolase n=1 Tax=Corallococcus terminator TaxID=2316733 RepID=A0A3A8HL69_9BACT|nr:alpha/beta fold hydrolase [Corallococcus terminator]RKG72069.1 alpha/beta fold hydrolase [Corallococcus terminator]